MKTCKKCDNTKSLKDFYGNCNTADGYFAKCKPCYLEERRVFVLDKATVCVDCGNKTKSCKAARCQSCSNKQRRGSNSPLYKTGRTLTSKGYVEISGKQNHPNANARGGMFEHIWVMSEILQRPLYPEENVHHKNGVKDDNRPENLELWSTSQPSGQRVEDKVKWAQEILALYL